jgi:predicted ATPase
MADGITRIAVEGFKSISKRQSIEIAPLTILAGANSSGKSSIMQPLLMLKQTLEAPHDPGPLLISGGNVKFTSSDQFFSRTAGLQKLVKRLSLEVTMAQSEFRVTFSKGSKPSLEVLEETRVLKGTLVTVRPNMLSHEIRQVVGKAYPFGDNPDLVFSIVPNRFFLDVYVQSSPPFRLSAGIEPWIQGVIHVPALRGSSSRTYAAPGAGPNFPATFDYYVASVIESWQTEKSTEGDSLNNDLRFLSLAQSITARRLTDVEIDLQVNRLPNGASEDMVSIADVGFGVSQTLPILVALRVATKGQLVYLEEPEIHLHPRAQVKLAHILANAAKRGVRVVAETHSSLLLRAVQTLVAKGELAADFVRLHWFSRDKTGVTQIKSVVPDENGAFGDWPEDFGDVNLQSEQDYLDAVESKLTR